MSQHHRKVKWSTLSRKYRAQIAPLLPLPCVQPRCKLGGIVNPSDTWDVAHLHDLAADPTQIPDRNAVGPAHAACNRSDGGKRGAAMTNRARAASSGRREW